MPASKEITAKFNQNPAKTISDDRRSTHSQKENGSNVNGLRNLPYSETWRSWSIQRAGFSDDEFEPAEIPSGDTNEEVGQASENEMLELKELSGKSISNVKGSDHLNDKVHDNDVRSCLRHLESELSMLLHSLSSKAGIIVTEKDHEIYSDKTQKLSDALEFQELETMNAQDELRSIRSKLSILEGKMSLAINDAHKLVEKQQKRITLAHRALHLLRTSYIVWPNAASEVLLAGSFDGWATQRKMVKSYTGMFSLRLKLYPGRYEIKFIVDGEWKIDPLRPVINDSGFENNLLIIA